MALKDKENKEIKRLNKSQIKTSIINLEDIEKLSVDKQVKHFENIFDKIYSDSEVESLRKYALRCIKLTCDPKDNKIHLPYGVMVQKKKGKLYIKVYKTRHLFLTLLFLTLLTLSILGASYSTINYSIVKNLNKDIDGDGIPELNLDLNNDKEADVNIDLNGDNKPDLNIDYKGNRKPIFNVDHNHNGKPDHNKINLDLNNDKVCDLNCDINGDGWPDINLSMNGNNKPDLLIDSNNDKKPDLNFDMNLDMKCDLHCDINHDNKCDKYCLEGEDANDIKDPTNTGSSTNIGNKDMTIQSGELVLEYEDQNEVYITDVYPEDQPGYTNKIPSKKFKVTNKSSLYIKYNLRWVIKMNDYLTDNFEYKISSTNNGVNFGYKTAPKKTSPISTEIIIPPFTTQEYSIDFRLRGTGGKQNEDQGKTFSGHVEIYLDNEI